MDILNNIDELPFDFYSGHDRMICQANTLVEAKQQLSLNAAKLFRGAVMQINLEDESLRTYTLSFQELSEYLGKPMKYIKEIAPRLSEELIDSKIYFRTQGGAEGIANIVSVCAYDKKQGLSFRLNGDLRPYLIGLKSHYTQIESLEYAKFTSLYAMRIFEIIHANITTRLLPKEGYYVDISIDDILFALDYDYKDAYDFKRYVLDVAVKEINQHSEILISYERLKLRSTSYDTVRFLVKRNDHPLSYYREPENQYFKDIRSEQRKKMDLQKTEKPTDA